MSFVGYNCNVFLDFSPAEKFLIGFGNDSCLLLFLYNVEINDRKGAVHLNSIDIFSDIVATDVCLTCKSDFDTQFVVEDVVIIDFEFELFSDGMDCYRILLKPVFDDSGVVTADSPDEHSAFIVLVEDRILQDKGAEFTDNANGLFVRMALDFTVLHS